MKKRLVLLLIVSAMIFSGCKNKENEFETIVPPTTENLSNEEIENSLNEDVQNEEIVDAASEEKTNNGQDNPYKEQMDLIYQALSEEWSVDKYFDNDISSLISNHYDGNALDNVGYALVDLDGDAKEELIISAISKDDSNGMLYDVYSVQNEEVVHILSGHERNRYYLQLLEEGGYLIANEASNSAYNSAWYYYYLSSGKLELSQGVVFNAEVDNDNPWFITYDEDWDVSNDTQDKDGLAQSLIEAYEKSYTTLEYIPFSTYNK